MGDTNTTGPNAIPDLESLRKGLSIRQQINFLERRLSSLFRSAGSTVSGRGVLRRSPMSAATRVKLAAAAKARWAKRKSSGSSAKGTKAAKKKGGLTAAGRKKLSDAMKARWAARRKKQPGKRA